MTGKLNLGDYKISLTDKLGQGSFGVVYKGYHKTNGFEVAAKQCEVKDERQGIIAMTEIKHFQHLQCHPHIVKLHDFNYKIKSFWMIMEYCDAGDLDQYFYANDPDLSERKDIMFQCASAIQYMHSRTNPAVHRDIKPQNIIMKKYRPGAVVKITDFGLAKTVEVTDPAMTLMFNTKCGTPGFMAPEFFSDRKNTYGKSVDVFSLGLVFLAMILHKSGDKNLVPQTGDILMPIGQVLAFHKQQNMALPDITAAAPDESHDHAVIKQLITNMTVYTPADRPKMADVEDALKEIGGSSPFTLPNSALANQQELPVDEQAGKNSDENLDEPNPVEETAEKSSGDVGFVMVKRAVEEAHKEKHGLDDDFLEREGFGGMALQNMLGDVMHQGRLTIGEKVMVDTDQRRVEKLMDGYGKWVDGMERYLGQFGIVTGVRRNVKVKFDDGRELLFNPKALMRTGEVLYTPEELCDFEDHDIELVKDMFKRYDIVKISTEDPEVFKCLQKSVPAGWNPRMKEIMGTNGFVKKVQRFNEIAVEFLNGDKWVLHPDILTHVDMEGHSVEAGDMVLVVDDDSIVKRCKYMFEKWDDMQLHFLGDSGIVKSVVSNKQIVVDMGKRSFSWHPFLLRIWAKGEDVMSAILRKTRH